MPTRSGFGMRFRLAWDRIAALGFVALGAGVLVLGWLGVSRQVYPAAQLPFIISGGIGGMVLLGLGAMFWLSADLQDEWATMDRIEEELRRFSGAVLPHGEGSPTMTAEIRPAAGAHVQESESRVVPRGPAIVTGS
jgi:hypothetical protein